MVDFARARKVMVDNQLRTGNVTDRRVLAAMGKVPREMFVSEDRRAVAYIDDIQPLGAAARRFMPPPAILAKLLQLAEIGFEDNVLDVGAGSGYSAAVMADLAASVVGIEADPALVALAASNLASLGLTNARIVSGTAQQPGKGSYDVIVVEGALDSVPQALFHLLKDDGRLVALMRHGAVAVATLYVKSHGGIAARADFNATLPPLEVTRPAPEFVF